MIKPEVKERLEKLKIIPQEPYNNVIERLLEKTMRAAREDGCIA